MGYGISSLTRQAGGRGVVGRLDARVKIIGLLCVSVYAVALDSAVALLILSAVSWILACVERVGWAKLRLLVFLVGLTVWGTMFSQSIFYFEEPRTVLVTLVSPETPLIGGWTGGISIYREGFRHGAVQSLRFASMMTFGFLFCWSTGPGKMLSGMLQLRVPYVLAFMTVTAVRFIPAVMDEFATVILAMRMRGGKIFSLNPARLLANWLKLIRPVFINCYRRSNILSLSIQSRAFQPAAARTTAEGGRFTRGEKVLLTAVLLSTAALVLLKILHGLYLWDILYVSRLRLIYEISRLYL